MTGSRSRRVPTAGHFGTYLAETDGTVVTALTPHPIDDDPSPIGTGVPSTLHSRSRLTSPMVRRGYLDGGPGTGVRGDDTYVPVSWDTAVGLVADEIDRVRGRYGNSAIYGGSYGWGSAGRFHHPQSQIHRFLNLAGGYTASVESYSSAAMQVVLRRVAGGYPAALASNPTWQEIAEHRSLVLAFGGIAARNAQVNGGGIGAHVNVSGQRKAREAGADFVVISPQRTDSDDALDAQWVPIVPGTDVAVMLGIAHTIVTADRHDRDFLERFTVGWDRFEQYLFGRTDGIPKSAEWASSISGIDAATIRELAHRTFGRRTVFATSYSLQRADHGEQAPWMALTLAAITGDLGLPGGGFGCALGALHQLGIPVNGFRPAAFEQGVRPIADFIPVARIADMLSTPGAEFDYDGARYRYPDIKMVYWAGGNPFHHHQDLNRLVGAWQRPDTVVVHEHFANSLARHADIVLPAATWLERNDFAAGADGYISAIVKAAEPPGDVKTDYEIFSLLSERLGFGREFTADQTADDWVTELYRRTRERTPGIPTWDELLEAGGVVPAPEVDPGVPPYRALRADPAAHPLATPSGRFEIFSETIAGFDYDDCPGHPTWLPPREWSVAEAFPLHLVSGQPERRLHSQFDNGDHSRAGKIEGREPILINRVDAAARSIADGDVVRVFNDRGQCLAGAVVGDDIMSGVVRLSTGAWYDPVEPGGLDAHGNPNVLTPDRGTSRLAQGPSAHSALVQVEKFVGPVPPIRAFEPLGSCVENLQVYPSVEGST
ncbi:molybdopterin-dependent oxidoreductase [Rhodococcoides kyotonense]|uniref:Biotin/methionine sulfoxide reductase n=1 Tax=Rhodococcoides kyotonense TaxID=398843 RepID=A0A239N6P2_9NOCA|nr:molybdopterin-dependent oxidoreductase [Rhodococcus kyotonensis]SNT49849.1 biotin/methionine sulfoxide reductase [Rhodococcus kyotonensis]